MAKGTSKQKTLSVAVVLTVIFLAGALGTSMLPTIRVKVPPVGEKSWSVADVIRPIGGSLVPKEKKQPSLKIDFDFMDIVNKVLPRSTETGKPREVSLTFVLGVLVPVAVLASYLLVLVSLLLAITQRRTGLGYTTLLASIASAYALGGTFYLGRAAEQAFQSSVEKASEGILGLVTKNLVQEISIRPDIGLYALLAFVIATYGVNRYGKRLKA